MKDFSSKGALAMAKRTGEKMGPAQTSL